MRNLRSDGTLWRWRTWNSAVHGLIGRRGLPRQTFRPWREYLRRDFHPSQLDASASERWLRERSTQYLPLGGGA